MHDLERIYKYDTYFALFQMLFLLVISSIVLAWLFRFWRAHRQLKNDKTEAELALLKSKIDPHFFFNTLNNLYGLAIEKADETPEVILKLSEVMRYTIYEGENETVNIKDEISYLEKYIEIHQIRYQKDVSILFDKEIDNYETRIPPLLFIMLLENAFKHGVESLTDKAYIRLYLKCKRKKISFTIENNFDIDIKANKGIGLGNLKKRLQLLYPKKHELIVSSKDGIFNVQLNFKLK